MSLFSRLFGKKPVPPVDVRDNSHWNVGDIAVCVSDNWLQPVHPDSPRAGSYWTVDGVEDSVVMHPALTTPVRGVWLYLIGAPVHCDARSFRKVVSDTEPAEAEFTALIKRPVRQRVPVATPGDRP